MGIYHSDLIDTDMHVMLKVEVTKNTPNGKLHC